ncbi:MAG TPA: hypothetical protein DIW27_09525 [Cytophagales bacterium]|nr:hypothetical protein [Cytophagales bacterium]
MFKWVPYAMVRIAAFFIAGILLGIYQADIVSWWQASVSLCLLVSLYLLLYFLLPVRQRGPIVGIIGLMAVFISGYVHLISFVDWNKPDHLSTYKGNIQYYTAELLGLAEEKENSYKYKIKILRVNDGFNWINKESNALLYVRKETGQPIYFYGDKLLVKGSPQLLVPPQNPHEFDFKRFLSFKNIYYQQFVKNEQLKLIANISSKDLKYFSYQARLWAADQLKSQLPNKKEQAIALALTLGVTDGIDNELQSAYASSGAMHVLAVSGLHVGIFYGIVLLLFRPLKNLSWSRWLIAAISIVVLWSFAFITGLSPSVLRAVTMFSFIALAKPFGRSTSIYNTLASSAFILLWIDPFLIMSVGFQLSYLAVLGIVTIHRPLYQWFEPDNRMLDWIWNISCVSIAAQMATFSLGLLYFHQFPVYFLFSNLFVIPGAISVLVTSIVVIGFSWLEPVAVIFGTLLKWFIQILNYGVFSIEKFPFSLINDIYINTMQCWFIMLSVGFFVIFLYSKKLSNLFVSFVFIVSFSMVQWLHFVTEVEKERFIVYDIPGRSGVEWITNGHARIFADSSLLSDVERMRFHIRPNRLYCGVSKVETYFTNKPISVFVEKGKCIGIINEPIGTWPEGLKLDYLIMGNNSFKSLAQIKNTINFDKLILDGTNSSFLANRIRKEDDELVHSVQHEGAYVEIF